MRPIDADELYVDARPGENEEPYISLRQINDAPTVDPVKHGHWTDNGHIGRRRWCSVCGGIAFEQYDDYGLAEVTETDYCPHCGAIMDEEAKDDKG